MNLSRSARTRLGVLLFVVGVAIYAYMGVVTQEARDTTGIEPDFGALQLVAAVIGALGFMLFLRARREST